MSAKCRSQNCNRKPETSNDQNLCILCYDWFQKCQVQHHQDASHYQELSSIYNNLTNGIHVDHNQMMRALIGSMMNMMSQSSQIMDLKEETKALSETVKVLEDELGATKLKLFHMDYDLKELEKKNINFSPRNSIVIRNLTIPKDGDEHSAVKRLLGQLDVEDFDPGEDILKVERKGQSNEKLGSVMVKLSDQALKSRIMKKKKDLTDNVGIDDKKLKIMNYKNQEQILFENALRSILSILPNGHLYEINGNVRLVAKNVEYEIQDKTKQRKQCLIPPMLGGSVISST